MILYEYTARSIMTHADHMAERNDHVMMTQKGSFLSSFSLSVIQHSLTLLRSSFLAMEIKEAWPRQLFLNRSKQRSTCDFTIHNPLV